MIFDMITTKLSGNTSYYGSIFETELSSFADNLAGRLTRQEQEKIIVLDTIDYRVLPVSTRLLSAILVRIDACIADQAVRAERLLKYGDALMQLQQLQYSVVIGFEGNLEERKGLLDPDAYAVEVIRAARATIGMTKRFHETLSAVVREYFVPHTLFLQNIILPKGSSYTPFLRLFDSPHILIVIARENL